MHEIMFAEKVIREAKKAGATKFFGVEVGELVEITKDELKEGLKRISGGNLDLNEEEENHGHRHDITKSDLERAHKKSNGLQFKLTLKQSKVRCSCGYEGRAAIIDRGHGYCLFNCPECGEKPKVLEGGEIKIVEVE